MDRRSFVVGGAVVGATVIVGDRGGDRVHPGNPAPRSDRPHGGHTGLLQTRVVWHTAPDGPRLALTFDDGPDPRWTPHVLDVLARHRVPATFYVVGSRAERSPALLARAVDAGHEIGNHTWSHADLCLATPAAVREELHRTAELVERLTGTAPATVRPPWGHVDAVGLLAAAELGATVVLWSELVRASDPGHDAATVLRDVRPGSVLLAHDGGPTPTAAAVRAVDRLIGDLKDRGYGFGTVADLVGEPAASPGPTTASVRLPDQRSDS